MENILGKLESLKVNHELPNNREFEYNIGYVKAINDSINAIKNYSIPDVIVSGKSCDCGSGEINFHDEIGCRECC